MGQMFLGEAAHSFSAPLLGFLTVVETSKAVLQ